MWRVRIQEEDSKLEAEKQIKYKGTARIGLKWLHFQRYQPRELDANNTERLKPVFRKDCRRLDVHNHIPAVIEQHALDAAIQRSGTSARQLSGDAPGGYPELVFPAGYQVECLHGQHRIQAAKELRLGWWTVDLYLANIEPSLRTCLVEEYSNEKKPSEGEIYRKIRQYHFQRNSHFERRWWGRLTRHGDRCLKQLLRHSELTAAFDALLEIPGLWGGMRISTLHTILATKCYEEILCYLGRIKDVFTSPFPGDTNALLLVNQETVETIELKAPRTSTADAKLLRGQLQGGFIFSAFSDQARADIWTRLQEVDGLIPSLSTFFKDMLYLKVLAGSMTRLIKLSPGETMATAFGRAFSDTDERNDRAVIQVTESQFASCPIDPVDIEDLGYRQLYAYAMRHYLEMPKDHRGNDVLARPTTAVDGPVLREFADLAERLGFHSPEITVLKQYPKASTGRIQSESSKPLLGTDGAGVKKKRSGAGRGHLVLFVRKSIYSAFFGNLPPLPLESLYPRDEAMQGRTERQRQEGWDQERLDQAWREQQRLEQEWQEQERLEQERQKQQDRERLEQEQDRQEQKTRQRQARLVQARKYHQKRLQRLMKRRLFPQRHEEQEQEREEQEGPQDLTLDDERRLEDQQRMKQDELLEQEIDEVIEQTPVEDISGNQSSGAQAEEDSGNTGDCINFKVCDAGTWKHAATHTIDRFDHSKIAKAAADYVRDKWRLFNTELRMLAPQQCYEAVTTDGTYTILLMRESQIDIDYDLMLAAMKIGGEAKEAVLKC